ncbi:MAG TPA: amidohydrolase family protein [Burkholderiales bacterium]|nr:amidohydrolase family protein [Burkholderiales bacterium]
MTGMRARRVDVHNHVLPRELLEAIRSRPRDYRMRVEERAGAEVLVRDDGHWTPIYAEFHDPGAKIESLDRRGLDVAVISVTPVVFFYWLDAEAGRAAARLANDGIARMVEAHPARLRGMATLPMQDPQAAVAELERVVREHGFRAVELGCRVRGELLSEPRYRAVLARAQALGVFVFVHPYIAGGLPPELGCYYLGNLAGLPYDTALLAAHLMFGGALDELPDLALVLAHGGGHLPYQIGRLEHGYRVRAEARARASRSPAALLGHFHFDSLTHDSAALAFLLAKVGAGRLVIGTDAPFDMGEENPLARIASLEGLSEQERERIYGWNALELLGEA